MNQINHFLDETVFGQVVTYTIAIIVAVAIQLMFAYIKGWWKNRPPKTKCPRCSQKTTVLSMSGHFAPHSSYINCCKCGYHGLALTAPGWGSRKWTWEDRYEKQRSARSS